MENGAKIETIVIDKFTFDIHYSVLGFYITCNHIEFDVRYNSLWDMLTFETSELGQFFCDQFNWRNYSVIGSEMSLV